ncbi:formate dehydrogenase accessory sulfurtransferase FdhD [Larkinella knui]|uniref:Sulfur carrier protein FdhD n=1 Tax=Larkinella knui TaxID=2025310 RepID=A0A3P1CPK3_9BACT|nr:formate dehydrogenase accessory sulfurtransferase FdhD [Larkinella knui]RRB15140.1 formate dehydrogenase accessory sulfurtransferase FdhD [Larkinella knui]
MLSVSPVRIQKISQAHEPQEHTDLLAVEEPLEIRLGYGPPDDRQQRSVAVTMRTPGHDEELALGFLFTENILESPAQIISVRHCVSDSEKKGNVLRVELQPGVVIDWKRLERHSYTASSCGICGKASIEAVQTVCHQPLGSDFHLEPEMVHALPEKLRESQRTFAYTGGLHAAALFDENGQLLLVREDIGRHNALDKLIGAAFWQGWLPLSRFGVLVSGRVAFELVQKCWMAGVPMLAAVGAPSSLAVELAKEAGMTLLGFVRDNRFNQYSPVTSDVKH